MINGLAQTIRGVFTNSITLLSKYYCFMLSRLLQIAEDEISKN